MNRASNKIGCLYAAVLLGIHMMYREFRGIQIEALIPVDS